MNNMNVICRPYKIFEVDGQKYIYINDFSGIYKIDHAVQLVLNEMNSTTETIYKKLEGILEKDKIDQILNDLNNFNILNSNSHAEIKTNNNKLQGITLMLCQDCNMRCSYCFAGDGQYNNKGYMSAEVGKKAIDFLVENSSSDTLTVCLFGGEPLLNFDLFKEMVNYCKHMEEITQKKIDITTTINGTLLTKEREKFLLDNKVIIQISLDGDEKTHNSNRYFEKKVGSYNKVIKNTEYMREKGLLSARATITKNNLDIIQIFNHLYDLNFRAVPFTPAFNLFNKHDIELLKNSYGKLIEYFESLIKKHEFNKAKKMTIIVNNLSKIHYGRDRDISCGLGNSAIAVDINGNIFPCHRFVSDDRYIIGNIEQGFTKREDFLEEINVENIDKCKNCWAKSLCIGGCPRELIENNEDNNIEKFDICEIHKFVFEKLIYVYLRLNDEEKQSIFR